MCFTENDFFNEFPIYKGNKKNSYVILFDACIGMGKSTVAKMISGLDNSIILNNDEVRYKFDYYGNSQIIYDLQQKRMERLLNNNNSCILDCNLSTNREERMKRIFDLGYKCYIIRLECSEEIIKERLQKRKVDDINYSIATYSEYLKMKDKITNMGDDLISYVINTEKDIEIQVKQFLEKFNLI